jgi:hypothetical protein
MAPSWLGSTLEMKRPDDRGSFETKARLHYVVNQLGAGLSPDRVRTIRELIDVGEGTIALEILAENLYDVDAVLSTELLDELRALATELSARGPFELLGSPPV